MQPYLGEQQGHSPFKMEAGYAFLRSASIILGWPLDPFGKLRASRLTVNYVARTLATRAAH
jgi:hypothetical protein